LFSASILSTKPELTVYGPLLSDESRPLRPLPIIILLLDDNRPLSKMDYFSDKR